MKKAIRRLKNRYYTVFLIIRLLLPVFLTILILILLTCASVLYSIIHPDKSTEFIVPSDYHMVDIEITWEGAGGDVMQGWFIRGSNQAPLIVICHGYETNRTEVLSLASRLKDQGYNIFLYNHRGHGKSPYFMSSLGLLETTDLKLAIEKLLQRPEVDFNRIGIYGTSLGAYTAINAARNNPKIQCLVLDSLYGSIDSFIALEVEEVVGLRSSLLSRVVSLLYALYFRVSPSTTALGVNPNELMGRTMLFITGGDKKSISLARETRQIYSEIQCKKEVLNLANSRESILLGEDRIRYENFVVDFFTKELPPIEATVKIELPKPKR